jgi:hypothetical protein
VLLRERRGIPLTGHTNGVVSPIGEKEHSPTLVELIYMELFAYLGRWFFTFAIVTDFAMGRYLTPHLLRSCNQF